MAIERVIITNREGTSYHAKVQDGRMTRTKLPLNGNVLYIYAPGGSGDVVWLADIFLAVDYAASVLTLDGPLVGRVSPGALVLDGIPNFQVDGFTTPVNRWLMYLHWGNIFPSEWLNPKALKEWKLETEEEKTGEKEEHEEVEEGEKEASHEKTDDEDEDKIIEGRIRTMTYSDGEWTVIGRTKNGRRIELHDR